MDTIEPSTSELFTDDVPISVVLNVLVDGRLFSVPKKIKHLIYYGGNKVKTFISEIINMTLFLNISHIPNFVEIDSGDLFEFSKLIIPSFSVVVLISVVIVADVEVVILISEMFTNSSLKRSRIVF